MFAQVYASGPAAPAKKPRPRGRRAGPAPARRGAARTAAGLTPGAPAPHPDRARSVRARDCRTPAGRKAATAREHETRWTAMKLARILTIALALSALALAPQAYGAARLTPASPQPDERPIRWLAASM